MILSKRYIIASMLGVAALLPMITATGSPTYTVFALLICAGIVPMGWSAFEVRSKIRESIMVVLIAILGISLVALKNKVSLPILSKYSQPLLAEQEKTHQMESVLQWWCYTSYSKYKLLLYEQADDPVVSKNVIDRRYRPPTSQQYLDMYAKSIDPEYPQHVDCYLAIVFGGQEILDGTIVHRISGTFADEVRVYRLCN